MSTALGDRVRIVIEQLGQSQASFAELIGLTKDKLSKSLTGRRRFTSLELALIADSGGVTVDWLLTGRTPSRPSLSARRGDASATLTAVPDVVHRCAAAYEVLDLLGADERRSAQRRATFAPRNAREAPLADEVVAAFKRHGYVSVADLDISELADAIEAVLGIDVVIDRLPPGIDGLAWQAEGHRLGVLASTGQWTRQRFTLAHEVGHLLLGHAQQALVDQHLAPGSATDPAENSANRFAAALLMPPSEIRKRKPARLDEKSFAGLVVDFKVSPSAMAARLMTLKLLDVERYLRFRAFTTVECHELAGNPADYVRSVNAASSPRLPSRLATAMYEAYRAGRTTLRPLAGLLDIDVDDLHDALAGDPAPDPSRPDAAGQDLDFAL